MVNMSEEIVKKELRQVLEFIEDEKSRFDISKNFCIAELLKIKILDDPMLLFEVSIDKDVDIHFERFDISQEYRSQVLICMEDEMPGEGVNIIAILTDEFSKPALLIRAQLLYDKEATGREYDKYDEDKQRYKGSDIYHITTVLMQILNLWEDDIKCNIGQFIKINGRLLWVKRPKKKVSCKLIRVADKC